ncbi:MAG: IS1 family transposase [Gammaproteobacteria bacterium]|nr:IS1 family transposase [Gammaproteobacteria bacterium]
MNRLSDERRAAILQCLTEGVSIRATSRLTGAAKGTILRLIAEAGEFASVYQDFRLQNLRCKRIEADELWAFVGAKRLNARHEHQGDIWTFTAIDPDTKLMVSWFVGDRSEESAIHFMADLADRLAGRVQISTDGHGMYLTAIREAFGHRVDYGQVVKDFRRAPPEPGNEKYSPPGVKAVRKRRLIGDPDMDRVSTSIVERANLPVRQNLRRFTRLTNGFSKKATNHAHAVSLGFLAYNFCHPHTTLTKARDGQKTTPAMAAGLELAPWTMLDVTRRMNPALETVTSN